MTADLLQQRYSLHNRWTEWRADAAQSLFLVAVAIVFLGLLLVVLDPVWARIFAPSAPWARMRVALVLALLLAIGIAFTGRRRALQLARMQAADWLAAMPIQPELRARFRRQKVLGQLALVSAGVLALSAWGIVRAGFGVTAVVLLILAGIAAGLLLNLRSAWVVGADAAPSDTQRALAAAVAIRPGTAGLALLGAAIEPGLARLSRSARWVAFVLMLLPVGIPLAAVAVMVLLFGVLGLSFDLIRHWRERYAIDQRWLAAQPLPPRRLLAAYLPRLVRRTLPLTVIASACVLAMGAPAWFTLVVAGAHLWLMAHALLCSYATRGSPRGFMLLLALHYLALIGSLQVLPLALPLLAAGCLWHAWRRGEGLR